MTSPLIDGEQNFLTIQFKGHELPTINCLQLSVPALEPLQPTTNYFMAAGRSVYSLLEESRYNLTCPVAAASHTVYTRLYQTANWSNSESLANKTESDYGAIYNIEFSPVDDVALILFSLFSPTIQD